MGERLRGTNRIIVISIAVALAIGLAVFTVAVVVPYLRVRNLMTSDESKCKPYLMGNDAALTRTAWIQKLGGQPSALRALGVYVGLPKCLTPGKATATWLLGACGTEATDRLVRLLRDPDWEVRYCAADSLRQLGSDAKSAMPSLKRVLDDPSEEGTVRATAARALGQMGTEGLRYLMDSESTDDPIRGVYAAGVLATGKGSARSYGLLKLMDALQNKEPKVRSLAARAFAGAGGLSPEAETVLRKLAEEDPNPSVRSSAAKTLESFSVIH